MTKRILLCIGLLAIVWSTTVAADPDASGTVKTSRGDVTIDRAGHTGAAPVGTAVFVGDRVRTGPDSYVGITLRDDTLLTGGPQSTLLITDFKFNADTHNGNVLVSFLKGTFSVVTGLIAKQSPKSVGFKTPTMTLGIRGTEFIVEVHGAAE
jgi:hypothetical protein